MGCDGWEWHCVRLASRPEQGRGGRPCCLLLNVRGPRATARRGGRLAIAHSRHLLRSAPKIKPLSTINFGSIRLALLIPPTSHALTPINRWTQPQESSYMCWSTKSDAFHIPLILWDGMCWRRNRLLRLMFVLCQGEGGARGRNGEAVAGWNSAT